MLFHHTALKKYPRLIADGELTIDVAAASYVDERLMKGYAVLNRHILYRYSSNYFIAYWDGAAFRGDIHEASADAYAAYPGYTRPVCMSAKGVLYGATAGPGGIPNWRACVGHLAQ